MTEVGNLRVNLGLDSAQFDRSITSLNRQLQTVGQEFRTLQNKGKDWGNSLDGLRNKQTKLTEMFTVQQEKVNRLSAAYEKAKAEQGEYSAEAQKLGLQLARAQAEMQKTETELGQITSELERQEAALVDNRTSWQKLGEAASQITTKIGENMKVVGEKMAAAGKELSMKLTTPIAALGVGATKAAIDFESAFAGVRKTVDTSEEGFKKLEKGILEMSRTLPASASDISAVAESAGQLGIAEDKILSFSRTIIDLGESTNMTREQAATEFARFANIVGMSQDNFDRLGSSIVGLGNSMATTEAEIMSMGMRLAGQGAQVGMSESQIMALSATMSSLGIQAEAGGTAMTTILKKIQSAVGAGGKELETFAKAAGMSGAEFKKSFETEAVGALDALVKGLAKSGSEGKNLTTILETMGIKGIYESDVLLRMSGASDLLSSALSTAGDAWEENSALSNEAAQRYETTASKLSMLKNKITEVGISFGNVLLPFILQITDALAPVITKLAEMDSSMQLVVIAIAGIAAAIGPVLVVLGTLMASLGVVVTGLGAISLPIVAVVSGIALLGAALVAAYVHFDGFREKVDSVFLAVKEIATTVLMTVVSFVKGQLSQLAAFWNENGTQILQAVTNAFNGIKAVIDFIMPAIKLVVETVWTAIKQVITGALDVIAGAVKIFSGLFTGDFEKMWEGVKQLFFGAIDVILGWMTLSFFGGIKTLITNFAKSAITLFKGMWDDIAKTFSGMGTKVNDIVNKMVSSIINFFKKMLTDAKSTFTSLKSSGESIFNSLKQTVVAIVTNLVNAVKTQFTNKVTAVKTAMTNVKTTIQNLWNEIITWTTSKISGFVQIGKDIINGLIKGISEMSAKAVESITGVVDGVVKKAKKMLGIESPSDVLVSVTGKIAFKPKNIINTSKVIKDKGSNFLKDLFSKQLELVGVN